MNKEEKIFLKNYDDSIYKKISIATDVILFSVSNKKTDNYRKTDEKKFSVLLVKRNEYPYKNCWSLPGGFVKPNETLEDSVENILRNKTNLTGIYAEQLYTFSNIERDPRTRVISVAYMALVDKTKLSTKILDNAEWFDICFDGNKTVLSNETESFTLEGNNVLAFDHSTIIMTGIERLRNKVFYTDIVFQMMPECFSLPELQMTYECIIGKKLIPAAFRRTIASKIEKTDKMMTGRGHRPSVLYKKKEVENNEEK